jgi:hypothetical protein
MILTMTQGQQGLSFTRRVVSLRAESYCGVGGGLNKFAFTEIVIAGCESIKAVDFRLDVGLLIEKLESLLESLAGLVSYIHSYLKATDTIQGAGGVDYLPRESQFVGLLPQLNYSSAALVNACNEVVVLN